VRFEAKSQAEVDYLNERKSLDYEFLQLLEEICGDYLDSDASIRAELRQFCAERPWFVGHVWDFARFAAERVLWPPDVRWLRIGLTAMAIEDCQFDYRDETVALGMLYRAAELAGIDPQPHCDEIAAISGEEMARKMRASERCAVAAGESVAHLKVLQQRKRAQNS
jgi:hypothetical protein